MAELKLHKCKLCGEPLDITKAVGGAVQCGYCGTMYTLPKETADDRLLNFLDSGELSLDKGDFEGAMTSYSKAAEIDGNEPEAHFGKALSKFKVRYIKDEVANRLQPICYEVTDKKFSDDPDYMRAYMKATPEQRAVYEEKAKDIDYIQSEFYNLKQSGLDYDCFICVKVTDDNTKLRTADYKYADDIYFALKKKYKPFFSERELTNVTGADYEARILYALYSSECMLVVCGDEEYLQTKWVKNEYSRFLKLVNDSEKETDSIAIAFTGKPIERLPGRNGKLQGIDLGKLGALSRVEEFVESHTPAARAKRAAEAEEKKRAEEEQKRRFEEQQRHIRELEERIANLQGGAKGNDLSDDELFERMERARAERERKKREEEECIVREKREREEAERKKREEAQRIARAKAEAERKLQEEIKLKPWLAPDYPTLKNYDTADFEISGTELKKYKGKRGDVKIPVGVTAIGDNAFQDCENLTGIVIPECVTTIGKYAFAGCTSLKNITIPNSVTSIGMWAFEDCKCLTDIIIPEGVTSIRECVFGGCEYLMNVAIPSSVSSISNAAFNYCPSLINIDVDINNKNYSSRDGILYNKDKTKIIRVPETKAEVEMPDSVTSIGEGAFQCCTYLKKITIPNGVTSIGEGAFRGCESLTSIVIPDGVTSIDGTFNGCMNLTNITIPNSVTSIGECAFANCKNLMNLVIPNSVTTISGHAFWGCTSLTSIIIPNSVISIEEGAFEDCTSLTTIYCYAVQRPNGWDDDWSGASAKVVWGYRGI